MRKWMSGLAILYVLWCSGCGARAAEPRPGTVVTEPLASVVLPTMPSAGERRVSRTIEDDPDADGIADYRVVITDTFDADGNPISSAREEDFEADGIIDARSVTKFD